MNKTQISNFIYLPPSAILNWKQLQQKEKKNMHFSLRIIGSGIGWQFYTHHSSWKTFIWQIFSWNKNGWFCLYGTYMQDWKADCLQLIFSLNLASPCLSTQQTLLILPCTNSPIMSLYFVTLVNFWFVLRPILLIQLEFTDNKITSLKYPQKMKSQ